MFGTYSGTNIIFTRILDGFFGRQKIGSGTSRSLFFRSRHPHGAVQRYAVYSGGDLSGAFAGAGDNAGVADGAYTGVVAGPYDAVGRAKDFPTAVVALNLHLPGALAGLQGEVRFAQLEAVGVGVDPGVALYLDLAGGALFAAGCGDGDGASCLAGDGAAVYGSNLRVGGAPGYGAAAAGGGDPPGLA